MLGCILVPTNKKGRERAGGALTRGDDSMVASCRIRMAQKRGEREKPGINLSHKKKKTKNYEGKEKKKTAPKKENKEKREREKNSTKF